MDTLPLIEAVHAGWASIMDDKVPVYMVKANTTDGLRPETQDDDSTTTTLLDEEEDDRPSLVIDDLRNRSALLDQETEAAIRTKGILIGYANIEDRRVPLYVMPQEDNCAEGPAAETGDEDEMPGLVPDKQDEDDLISLKSDPYNNPGVQEASLDSFEERMLQALGGFEMLTIREAYFEASELHANTIGALPIEDYLFTGRIGRAANYFSNVLKSFRRQMLRGIDQGMVLTMLLHLRIVVNVLGQVFPAHRGIAAGTRAPPSTPNTDNDHNGALAQENSGVVNNRAPNVVSNEGYHQQRTNANPTPPVELDAGLDGASAAHDIRKQHEMSGEDVKANAETSVTDEGLDDWSWEDIAEADDFAEVIGWEML